MNYEIYTDGSCRSNGAENAVGAWGYIILDNGVAISRNCGIEFNTTNQRMEMMAIINACKWIYGQLNRPLESVNVYTDSAYVQNCYKERWYINWLANDWRNSKKEPVANKDLWEELIPFFEHPQYHFVKVTGHADDYWNNAIDSMVQRASMEANK